MSSELKQAPSNELTGFDLPLFDREFRKVVFCRDKPSGLQAIIAIHSTALGPANGGVRMLPYASAAAAMDDALRLARAMTYKWAAAGENRGGGKAVIIGDPAQDKSEALFRAFGRFVESLNGEYYVGEDVGTTLEDMAQIFTETNYVATLPKSVGGIGDISEATAFGAVQAMRACAQFTWGDPNLKGRTVALQGLGMCGSKALDLLLEEGAVVTATDLNVDRVEAAARKGQVKTCAPADIFSQPAEIFAPFALGGVINDRTIGELSAEIIAGSANNIFAERRHGDELELKGIVYAVDYIANAGGAIMDAHQFYKGGFNATRAQDAVARIFERTLLILEQSRSTGVPSYAVADSIAEARLAAVGRMREI